MRSKRGPKRRLEEEEIPPHSPPRNTLESDGKEKEVLGKGTKTKPDDSIQEEDQYQNDPNLRPFRDSFGRDGDVSLFQGEGVKDLSSDPPFNQSKDPSSRVGSEEVEVSLKDLLRLEEEEGKGKEKEVLELFEWIDRLALIEEEVQSNKKVGEEKDFGFEEEEEEESWQRMLEDSTSRAFVLALRIHRSRLEFEAFRSLLDPRSFFQVGGGVSGGGDAWSDGWIQPPSPSQLRTLETSSQAKVSEMEAGIYSALMGGDVEGIVSEVEVEEEEVRIGQRFDEIFEEELEQQGRLAGEEVKGEERETTTIQPTPPIEIEAVPMATSAPPKVEADEKERLGIPTSKAPTPTRPSFKELESLSKGLRRTYGKASSPLSLQVFKECNQLCKMMSVPTFWTGDGTRSGGGRIHEAEAFASVLVREGFADMVVSEDSDVLCYDVMLLRGVLGASGVSGSGGGKRMEIVDGKRVRECLFPPWTSKGIRSGEKGKEEDQATKMKRQGIQSERERVEEEEAQKASQAKMIDFALLCGTDFCRTIPGVGPRTALKLIQEHGSISKILRLTKTTIVEEEVEEEAREGKPTSRKRRSTKVGSGVGLTRSPSEIANEVNEDEGKKKERRRRKSISNVQPRFQPPQGMTIRQYEMEVTKARKVYNEPPKVRKVTRSENLPSKSLDFDVEILFRRFLRPPPSGVKVEKEEDPLPPSKVQPSWSQDQMEYDRLKVRRFVFDRKRGGDGGGGADSVRSQQLLSIDSFGQDFDRPETLLHHPPSHDSILGQGLGFGEEFR